MATVTTTEAEMVATELSPGTALGEDRRYRLHTMLGTGGMASVWLGDDIRLARPVAIKILADSLALDADYVSRFEREARVAARLFHPNLVNVFDFSAGPPRPYLVMEYVPGETLADRLRSGQRSDWDPETVFHELMSALRHVHSAGIIHRDIKPGNVLVGEDGRSRLTDFGVARPFGAERLTSTGLVIGTARYIAPEILRGLPADERSDLFACGVLLQDCLGSAGPRDLRVLAERLTAEDPKQRPGSAAEVLELLDRRARTSTLRPTSVVQTHLAHVSRQGREIRVRLRRSTVLAAAVVAVLVAAFVALATSGSGGPHRASAAPRPPSAGAPLKAQLDFLDRVVGQARR